MASENEDHENEGAIDPQKLAKIEKEKKQLLASLDGGDYSSQTAKVAAILNLYPQTRNSDITLALQYWESFQPDIFNRNGILPKDLFKLERQTLITRARAKIQNEYGLFQADEKVKHYRKKNEEEMHEAVLQDVAPRKVIHVYADETGKTDGDLVIVAAVWVLTGKAGFDLANAIRKWKAGSPWAKREIHFSKFSKNDVDTLKHYLGVVYQNREFLSFKVIAVDKSKTKRTIGQVIEKLHEHMLLRGVKHEIEQKRVDLPREIGMTMDEEQSLDAFAVAEMENRVKAYFEQEYTNQLTLSGIKTVCSRDSPFVQLADVIAGAMNRRFNYAGPKNHKDEMAEHIIGTLDIALTEEGVPGLDVSALFKV